MPLFLEVTGKKDTPVDGVPREKLAKVTEPFIKK
jgi:hypothetical protein